jgi:hypothetical protein
MFRMAYTQGAQDALYKYAGGVTDALLHQLLASEHLKRNLNVAGLGLIAAPAVHDLVRSKDEEESPSVHKAKHLSDLAGLGLLIGTEFMKSKH